MEQTLQRTSVWNVGDRVAHRYTTTTFKCGTVKEIDAGGRALWVEWDGAAGEEDYYAVHIHARGLLKIRC